MACRVALWILLVLVSSCHEVVISKTLEGKVTTQNTENLLFWKRGKNQLSFTSTQAAQEFQKQPSHMVMISFNEDDPLALELKTDPKTHIYSPAQRDEQGFALIQVDSKEELQTLAEKAHDQKACGNIEMITGMSLANAATIQQYSPVFAEHVHLEEVEELLKKIDQEKIKTGIKTLVDMGTRGHSSYMGEEVPQKILTMVDHANPGNLSAETISLNSDFTDQNNVVVTLDGNETETSVIVAAHMDTILGRDPTGTAPGADDDASGVATLIEVLRVLSEAKAVFKRQVEFHFYAAEEVGLLGSASLAQDYRASGKRVAAMLQLDMDSFSVDENAETIYLVTNDTQASLRRSLKNLLNTYLGGDYEELALKAGTSDHRSWTNNGYPTVFPFEHPWYHNQALHTSSDTMETAHNFSLTKRFAKLVLAFLAHHAGLVSADAAYDESLLSATLMEDIKVAITAGNFDYEWNVVLASSTKIHGIETCAQDTETLACNGEFSKLEMLGSFQDRIFFATSELTPLNIEDGENRILYAYDENDKLMGKRIIHVRKKT